jgi:hypothetical protein
MHRKHVSVNINLFIKAGRIGSGRFDRGERDDRQRGDAPGTMKGSCLATRASFTHGVYLLHTVVALTLKDCIVFFINQKRKPSHIIHLFHFIFFVWTG